MSANISLTRSFRLLCISVAAVLVSLPALPLRAADNQPPVVNITYPKGGDLIPTGVQVLIMATVEDLDGSVVQVEFFANGTSLGTVQNPVYAVGLEWSIGSPGAYTLTAIATDNSGATASSSDINVQVTPEAFVVIEGTDTNAAEGNPVDPAKFTVRRWGSTTEALTVSYQVSGTATAGSDYVALPGSVTIPAGLTTADLVITPLNDDQVEDPETVVVELLADTGYRVIEPSKAQATIADHKLGNAAPTVVIVGPADGAKFTAPATILLKARAEDSDGTVSGVAF